MKISRIVWPHIYFSISVSLVLSQDVSPFSFLLPQACSLSPSTEEQGQENEQGICRGGHGMCVFLPVARGKESKKKNCVKATHSQQERRDGEKEIFSKLTSPPSFFPNHL